MKNQSIALCFILLNILIASVFFIKIYSGSGVPGFVFEPEPNYDAEDLENMCRELCDEKRLYKYCAYYFTFDSDKDGKRNELSYYDGTSFCEYQSRCFFLYDCEYKNTTLTARNCAALLYEYYIFNETDRDIAEEQDMQELRDVMKLTEENYEGYVTSKINSLFYPGTCYYYDNKTNISSYVYPHEPLDIFKDHWFVKAFSVDEKVWCPSYVVFGGLCSQ